MLVKGERLLSGSRAGFPQKEPKTTASGGLAHVCHSPRHPVHRRPAARPDRDVLVRLRDQHRWRECGLPLALIDPVLSLVGTTKGTKEEAATAQSKSEGLRFRRILVSADNGVPAISRQFPTQSRRLGRVHRGEQVDGPLELIGGTPVLTPPLVEVRSEDQGLRLPDRRAEL